ncbi:hypothetical protein [Escherichia coli]|uniref:hypothetical protein n=1 Tax=Escherichia coli TaxID=562 RepID=UPI001494ED34|nr:hypothetical protein [Escherichia coli]
MCQHQAGAGFWRIESKPGFDQPIVHGIGRCHCWQAKKQTLRFTRSHQPVRQDKRRFRFTCASHIFQNK